MIERDVVDRIMSAANIVEVISDYVTLKRKGANFQACCPFHNEKTPSFVVSPSKGLFKCFGCGKAGNAVTFVMEHESISYPEALKIVAKKYGIEVREREMTEEDIRRNDNRESMFALNSWISEYFIRYMQENKDEGLPVGMSYFSSKRGFSATTIRKFGLGMCPSGGDRMTRDAIAAGYKEEFLLATGLTLKRESDGRLYDRFRERVMFPIHNISGRIVGFGGRTMRTDKSVAKYQNSPESEIYNKSYELYGLYFAKKAIQQADYAIMVEGYTDVISMHQAGVENVVASSGTSLTIEQIRLIRRFTNNLTIIYDSDAAGIKASLRGIDLVLKEGMNVRVVLLPEGDDPDSFARANRATEVQSYIAKHEQDFITFKAQLLLKEAADDPIKRSTVTTDIVNSISQIPDNIKRSMFIAQCSKIMDVDQNLLISEVARRRMMSLGDSEAEAFIRRQQQQIRRESGYYTQQYPSNLQPTESVQDLEIVEPTASAQTLEKEIIYYLLKYGDHNYEKLESGEIIKFNVAREIVSQIDNDGLVLKNPIYEQIMAIYRVALSENRLPSQTEIVNNTNPELCTTAVDILTLDDNYIESEIWSQKDMHSLSESEMLSTGIPKLLWLYKAKVTLSRIAEINQRLASDSLTEDEFETLLIELTNLNRLKVSISNHLGRTLI
ncbi:MAG: DNA primase [Alistipes sp.]|nr:DNA primase [Alistipes sp.]